MVEQSLETAKNIIQSRNLLISRLIDKSISLSVDQKIGIHLYQTIDRSMDYQSINQPVSHSIIE